LAIPTTAYKRLVGEVYNNSSSNLMAMVRLDDRVTFLTPLAIYANRTLPSGVIGNYDAFALPAPLSTLSATAYVVQALDIEAGAVAAVLTKQLLSGTTNPVTNVMSLLKYGDTGAVYGPTGFRNPIRVLWPYNGSGYVYAMAEHNGTYDNQSLSCWGYILPR
jgi:hypothetical protein